MVEVSFYVLPTSNEAAREKLLIKLLEKACEANEPTLLYSDDMEMLKGIDRKLWEVPNIEFLPHALIETEEDINEYDFIYLADKMWDLENRSLLLNIHPIVSEAVKEGQFKRVFEVITQDPQVLEESRNRYRLYRDLGFKIQTHKL